MKKIIMLVSLALVLVLGACQSGNDNDNNNNNENENNTEVNESENNNEEEEQNEAEKEKEAYYDEINEMKEIDGGDDIGGVTIVDADENRMIEEGVAEDASMQDDDIYLILSAVGYDDDEDEYFVEFWVENKTDDDLYMTSEDMKVDDVDAGDFGHLDETVSAGDTTEVRYTLDNEDGKMDVDNDMKPAGGADIEFTINTFEGDSDDGERLGSYEYLIEYFEVDSGYDVG